MRKLPKSVGLPAQESGNFQLLVLETSLLCRRAPVRVERPLRRAVALRHRSSGVFRVNGRDGRTVRSFRGRSSRRSGGFLDGGGRVSRWLILASEANGRETLQQRHPLLIVTCSRIDLAPSRAELILRRHGEVLDPRHAGRPHGALRLRRDIGRHRNRLFLRNGQGRRLRRRGNSMLRLGGPGNHLVANDERSRIFGDRSFG